jgi:hypothetical protein
LRPLPMRAVAARFFKRPLWRTAYQAFIGCWCPLGSVASVAMVRHVQLRGGLR